MLTAARTFADRVLGGGGLRRHRTPGGLLRQPGPAPALPRRNRRINRVLRIIAVVQLRNQTRGRAYHDARRAGGMPSMMAMRAMKRRLSNVVFSRILADQKRREASPGGPLGTPADSSVAALTPGDTGPSDKPRPRPATSQPKR